jgi:hypothetical protein
MTIAGRYPEQAAEEPLLQVPVRADGQLLPARWWRPRLLPAPSLLLAWALIVNVGIVNSIVWYVTPPQFRDGLFGHTVGLLYGWGGGDSWGPMTIALNYFERHPDQPLYSELLSRHEAKFQYPPSALFALMALRLAGPERIPLSHIPVQVWPSTTDVVGWVFMAAMIAAVVLLLELRLARDGTAAQTGDWRPLRITLAIAIALTFYLALKAFTLGQIQVWINSAFAIALLLWACGQKHASGIAIGLICLIKPHYALFLVWAAMRREWQFLTAAGVVFGIGLAAAIAYFGLANHLDYLSAISLIGQHGEAYFPNQSVNGLLNRLVGLGEPELYNNLLFRYEHFPPFNPIVFWGTTLTSAALLLLTLLIRPNARDGDKVWDFSRMALTITIASPIAWEHHYGILLPILAVLLAGCLRHVSWLLWLGLGYVLTSNFAPLTFTLAETVLNPIQSSVLLAAVIVLTMLYLGPPPAPHSSQRAPP